MASFFESKIEPLGSAKDRKCLDRLSIGFSRRCLLHEVSSSKSVIS
jgi:hypothetical protein